jgi:uncharacterized membrane protein YhiD involved in acid resistance
MSRRLDLTRSLAANRRWVRGGSVLTVSAVRRNLEARRVALDPCRVAAPIVTGVGLLSGGLMFVCRDFVRCSLGR